MSKSSNYWDKRALKRLTDAEKHSEVYIDRVKRIYEQANKDIERELASIYKNYSKETGLDTQKLKELLTRSETKKTWEQMRRQGLDKYVKDNYKSRISRLEQLQAQIYAKAKAIYPKEELESKICYKGVINQSYYKTVYDTQMGTGYAFNFATIDNNMIDSLLQDPWSGKNYSERIWGNTDILADSLSQILGGAVLSGQSMERTAKQMRDRFNVSKYYAERLIRTETNHFNNEVDAMAYEEMGLDKYVFVATLDSRTSEICQSMDNKVFNFSEREEGVNYPPLHPNCRSKTRAYLGKEEEKTLQRRARNPQTGKTELIDNISYRDWIKQYTNDENNKKIVKNDTKTTKNIQNMQKTNNKTPKTVIPPIKIDKNIDNTIGTIMNEAIKDIHNSKYSRAFDNLQKISVTRVNNYSKLPNGCVTTGYRLDNVAGAGKWSFVNKLDIRVKSMLNNEARFKEWGNVQKERGFWATANEKGNMYHELGHSLVHNMYLKDKNLESAWLEMAKANNTVIGLDTAKRFTGYFKEYQTSTVCKDIVDDTIKQLKLKDSSVAELRDYTVVYKQISEYATSDYYGAKEEAFAELFSKLMNGDNDKITTIFGKVLDKKLEELDML